MHGNWSNVGIILIGILQLIVFGYQGYWLKQTVRTAQRAASTVAAIERPYFVFQTLSGFKIRREQIHRQYVEYCVVNIGRTPALLDGLWMSFCYGKTPPDSPRKYKFVDVPDISNIPLGCGMKMQSEFPINIRGLNFHHDISFGPDIDHDKNLYFIALAKYHDVTGDKHETGLCRIYSTKRGNMFEEYGGRIYNYHT
jgi:hypothetical protein